MIPLARVLRVLVVAATSVLLAACGATQTTPQSPAPTAASSAPSAGADALASEAILARLGVSGTDVTRVIESLDKTTAERNRQVLASVRYDALVLKDGAREASMPIPDDRFYLSVAPYIDRTHECFFHSLTTCQGELTGKEMQVRITDSSGTILADGPVTTYTNGFAGFWLPRDITGTITVSYGGRTATAPIATTKDSPTCLTTLKLG